VIVAGVTVAGAIGAVLRYLIDRWVQARFESDFPYGTLVINVTGSLILGLLVGSALHHGVSSDWLTVLGTGLIGAYTTFSTFTFDTFRLSGGDARLSAVINLAGSLLAGLAAAAAGLALGSLT
jgi:CrcB protein